MIPAKDSTESNTTTYPKNALFEGASFSIQPEEDGDTYRFSIILGFNDIFVCQSTGILSPETSLVGSEFTAHFQSPSGSNRVKIKIIQQSIYGDYIAFSPIQAPTYRQKRKLLRLKPEEGISFRIQFEGLGNIYRGLSIEDLSEGGVGVMVRTAGEIDKNTPVKIFIELPRHDPMVIAGVVTNCSKKDKVARAYRIGIRFTAINTLHLEVISRYIKEHSK